MKGFPGESRDISPRAAPLSHFHLALNYLFAKRLDSQRVRRRVCLHSCKPCIAISPYPTEEDLPDLGVRQIHVIDLR